MPLRCAFLAWHFPKLPASTLTVRGFCGLGQAVEMEAIVTPVMLAIAGEHYGQLHGMEYRVKSALSMMRKVVAALRAQTHEGL